MPKSPTKSLMRPKVEELDVRPPASTILRRPGDDSSKKNVNILGFDQ